jgi:kinesin family protein 6/9
MYINKSLSFLEQVVLALADKRREHFPFRQSKLTHCLKDSIGGNCNTRLIANVWAEAAQIEETISTMRFATRMMCIAVEPAVNLHFEPAVMVKNLEKELTLLKRELAMHDILANRNQVTYDPLSEQQRYEIRQQVRSYLEGKLSDIEIINLRQISGVFEAFREISNQMAKEIEDRLRERYTLIDKADPTAIAAAQQAGIPINDDGELIGEMDMKGFAVGPTSTARPAPSAVINARKKDAAKKAKAKESPPPKTLSPVQQNKLPQSEATAAHPAGTDKEEKHDEPTAITASRTKQPSPPRPSTPPPRTEAFEEFKRDAGIEINRILTENKDLLASKKKAYSDVARLINCTKEEMDKSLSKLNRMREQREAEGNTINEDGDIIITEAEYLEIKRVKDLKQVYRENYEELRAIKAEVQHCQRYVDQCRQRLIQEFDTWYEECYLGSAANALQVEGQASSKAVMVTGAVSKPADQPATTKVEVYVEDEQEKFERLQRALLMSNPESVAFYNAQMRTQRRKIYDAAASQSPLGPRRKPGTPTRVIRNQPPTMLQVQY